MQKGGGKRSKMCTGEGMSGKGYTYYINIYTFLMSHNTYEEKIIFT